MSDTTFGLDDRTRQYLLQHSLREHPLLAELRAVTHNDPLARMQISPEQGQFMALLVQALGARRCIEIGTFTGYSALVVALALPDDGFMVCCDINSEWTAIAQTYWKRASVAHKIDLRLAPAIETLNAMLEVGEAGAFDFAFIDADKENYLAYYERCLSCCAGAASSRSTIRCGPGAWPTTPIRSRALSHYEHSTRPSMSTNG